MSNCVVNLLKTTAIKTTAIGFGFCLVATQSAIAADVYKLELQEISPKPAQTLQGETYKRIRGQSEWAVLKVTESGSVQFQHLRRKSSGVSSTWTENSVMSILACPIIPGDCVTLTGNQFALPKSKTIKDFSFEFQFLENDVKQVRWVQVPTTRMPEVRSRSASPRK